MYDFILFTPFDRARALGVYKIAKVLRDQGRSVKVIDFLQSFIRDSTPLLLWLREHVHENTIFGFSGTFMGFAITNGLKTDSKVNKKDVRNSTRDNRSREKYKNPSKLLVSDDFQNFVYDLKLDFPNCKIVIGGAGFIAEFIFRNLPIDHLILGYGEDAAAKELIDVFKGKEVPNIINQNPFNLKYDFHNSVGSFHVSDNILPNEVLPLEISRGCRFNCKFCSFALKGRKMTDQYFRDKTKIYNELIYNYDTFGTTDYNILCDTFNESNDKLMMVKSVFDKFYEKDLLNDKKELSEHLMLLDLGRNDAGKVSKINTVKVTESFIIERYSHVMHIVSNVIGVYNKKFSKFKSLLAGFPAGTVSGAPKIRAMEIIDELEKTKRKVYAGGIGYFSANGEFDTCIALRTAVAKNNKFYVQAGAGIVADSKPLKEYEETVNKAKALINALK